MALKGDLAWGAPHESIQFRERTRKLSGQANENVDARVGIGEFAHGISRDQRDWADLNIRPIERSLSESIRNRINGDQRDITQSAQQGVLNAYDDSLGSAQRSASRYGITLDDPSLNRGFELDRTKNAIQAGTVAAQVDRDNALRDAGRFYQSGAYLPGSATQQYVAGAGSLADQNDFATGQKYGALNGQIDAQASVGQGWANAFKTGGTVRGPMSARDIDRQIIEGRAKRVYAEGGGVDATRLTMGGRPGMTIKLRNQFNDYYTSSVESGESPKQWPQWLEDQGYTLEKDNLVQPKRYADGGDVGPGIGQDMVELESGEFIVPAKAVEYYGRDFWDKLVAEHGGETGDEARYAGGGGVGVGFGSGYEQGYAGSIGPVVGAVKRGLTAGLLDARATEEHDLRMANNAEDRTYLREDRAYQAKQRNAAETKAALDRDLNGSIAKFVQSDGTDLAPIVDVHRRYFGSAESLNVTPGPDGNSYSLAEIGPDGKPSGQAKTVTKDELRSIGMNMIEAMRDPGALVKSWNEKPPTVTTGEGAQTRAYNRRTGKWDLIADNPKDPKAEGRDKYNQQRAYDQISRLIGERLGGKYDDFTGKMIKPPDDPQLASELTARGHQYERQNPGKLGPGEIVGALFNDAELQRSVSADAEKKAKEEVNDAANPLLPDFLDPNIKGSREEMVKKRKAEILRGRGYGVGQNPANTVDARTPDQVKADYKAGRISRDAAKKELQNMGFK